MIRSAILSPCGKYRYSLTREDESLFDSEKRHVVFVLNNPSTADAESEDHTSRKGWAYTVSWGYRRMSFVNTNPYRSTDPSMARIPPENILSENDTHLRFAVASSDLVICAWGADADPILAKRALTVLRFQKTLHVLKLTKAGIPWNP
jgi:hypothetical protein